MCSGSADATLDGVAHDSRDVRPGMLFVPLVAARDGHDFIADAVSRGAAGYLTAREPAVAGAAAVRVDDTARALRDLAAEARRRLGNPAVVGITGSVGKTTTKDLLAAVLGRSRLVWASRRSFNNEIGVPITILSAPEGVQALVVEMGARGPGHIASLCDLARPNMGVVTNVGLAHTSEFLTLESVAAAKRALVEALPPAAEGGAAFLNAGAPRVAAMAAGTRAKVVTYGAGGEVSARDVTIDDELTPRFTLCSPYGQQPVVLGARGAHLVDNALAAAAVALHLGVAPDEVAAGLAEPTLSPHRMELLRSASGARLIDDCYNANPASMRAALEALAALPARRRLAVLGTMAELGDFSEEAHAEIGAAAAGLGVGIVTVNAAEYSLGGGVMAETADIDGAFGALRRLGWPRSGDVLLVKASRVAGLERLLERLISC